MVRLVVRRSRSRSSTLSTPRSTARSSSWLLVAPPGSSWLLLAPPGSGSGLVKGPRSHEEPEPRGATRSQSQSHEEPRGASGSRAFLQKHSKSEQSPPTSDERFLIFTVKTIINDRKTIFKHIKKLKKIKNKKKRWSRNPSPGWYASYYAYYKSYWES